MAEKVKSDPFGKAEASDNDLDDDDDDELDKIEAVLGTGKKSEPLAPMSNIAQLQSKLGNAPNMFRAPIGKPPSMSELKKQEPKEEEEDEFVRLRSYIL
jgi:hypothetical protein